MSTDALWRVLERAAAEDLEDALWAKMIDAHGPSAAATAHMDQGMRGRMLSGIFDLLFLDEAALDALMDFEVPNHRSYGATAAGYEALFTGLTAVLSAYAEGLEETAALRARCDHLLGAILRRNP
ncbi:MAG: hypothetical protein RLZZ174_454 [Pseudomonadota bacterium]